MNEIKERTQEGAEQTSEDFDSLKKSFAQLKDDVTKLLSDALGTGKGGAGAIKDRAVAAMGGVRDKMDDLRESGAESVEKIGEAIGERPLISAAIAIGVGFVLAKLISSGRK